MKFRPSARPFFLLTASLMTALSAGCSSAEGTSSASGEAAKDGMGAASEALGTTYQVGPSRAYKTLADVASQLKPGDVVELDGDATYPGGVTFSSPGASGSPITIRGVRVNGKRPVISGGYNGVEANQSHYVFEALDITGSSARCFFHHADDITVRDSIVHDCAGHGILGADTDSGSLTLDYVEVHHAGAGTSKHPIYIATDESAYPGSVFRMQHSYVHDGNGGNNVKSRAERNEIRYNWIEGAMYKEIELIGPDGQEPGSVREDSDVVGNVFRKKTPGFVARIGGDTGDGTSCTNGRYRFASNTFVLASGSNAAIHVFDCVESLEAHNNAFYNPAGGAVTLVRDEGKWLQGSPLIGGSNNWVPTGTATPSGFSATRSGDSPGLVSATDLHPQASSPLVDAGLLTTVTLSAAPFPSPLLTPTSVPPPGAIEAVGSAPARPAAGALDIGAYEAAGATSATTATSATSADAATSSASAATAPAPAPAPTTTADATAGAPAATCQSAQTDQWLSTAMPSQSGTFTAEIDVTPSSASLDAAVGLSQAAATAWSDMAAIVRFNASGTVDVRNGSAYAAAASFPYAAGSTYHVRMTVDVAAHTYSVTIAAPGQAEVTLATGSAFRTEQAQVTSLSSWTVTQTAPSGELKACGATVQ